MKNIFLCAALLAGSVFAFANEVEPTKEVEKLKTELTSLEDVYNCNDYGYDMAMIEDSPSDTNDQFMESQAFWIQACVNAGGCPCEILEPVYID
jgi:hypothetical protein